jgi:16S rRNA (uracil1498-N3)-methyltransferase
MVERSDRTAVATFFSTDTFAAGTHVSLGEDAAQHARVLRLGPGEPVELRDGAGRAARGSVARIAKRSISVNVVDAWDIPSTPEIHMLVPVGDRDHMLLLAEKLTELGASSWRPVIWRRSKSVAGRGEGPTFVARIRARMISALTQSGGGWIPEIHPSANVERAISASPAGHRILLDARSDTAMLSSQLNFPLVIALGPEGGLADDERQQMIDAGFAPRRIATAILRFETAGITALGIARAVADASNKKGETES